MQPSERDLALLWDMREAVREISEFMQDAEFVHFSSNKMLRYAVERQLIVLGEAAKKVSEEFRQAHPEIAWRGLVGQRNVLAHEYGEILIERIWLVATEKIPALLPLLENLIPPPPETLT
jgi:uncharacterized protein with HEPN domain